MLNDAIVSQLIVITILTCIVVILVMGILLSYAFASLKNQKTNLNKLTSFDSLTGARNKQKFIQDSKTLLKANNCMYAIIALDIENFKITNDLLGFETGDEILRYTSESIKTRLSLWESYGRFSGDNFYLMMSYTEKEDLTARLEGICRSVSNYNMFGPKRCNLVVCCGIFLINKAINDDVNTFCDRAALALKTIKGSSMNSLAFYTSEIRRHILEANEIERDMCKALKDKEFVVFLQPKFDLMTLNIVGAEALVRWEHPTKGLLQPNTFINIFEKNMFILELDMYVLEEVCKMQRKWIDQGINPLPVAINQSRLHLHDKMYITQLENIVRRYGIPPSLIELELTETVVFENIDILVDIINTLHQKGFTVSMDDFGSGYSSLNLLKDLPVDVLKLDRTFLNETDDPTRGYIVVTNVITMAKELMIKTVSEGVETDVQVEFIKRAGCDLAQGFYFAKPMPLNEYEKLLY